MISWVALTALGAGASLGLLRVVRTYRDLGSRRYPRFVYDDADTTEMGIPVFTYHSVGDAHTPDAVSPVTFERDMRYLVENGYRTLRADELYERLTVGADPAERAVVLTFDDARATLWTVAYPILRRYGLCAVCFAVPLWMPEDGMRPTMDESRDGTDRDNAVAADRSPQPMLTWPEAQAMCASGTVDFQSHTLEHALVYCGPKIIDFARPGLFREFNACDVPMIRVAGTDVLQPQLASGTPIYHHRPRMCARRFFDDEGVRAQCVEYVRVRGGEAFFTHPTWRHELESVAHAYRAGHALDEGFETAEEQAQALRNSLVESKRLIEEHLPGHTVRHLCYPWHRYSILAAALAREAGYISAYIDINPQKLATDWNNPYAVQRTLPTNETGDDPFQITRIDARDDMVPSLPGRGRRTYRQRFLARLLRPPRIVGQRR